MLGFQCYGTKFPGSEDGRIAGRGMLKFLDELAVKAQSVCRAGLGRDSGGALPQQELGLSDLAPCQDVAYASEKLQPAAPCVLGTRRSQPDTSPSKKVLQGLFGAVERLFSVKIQPDQSQTWRKARPRCACCRERADGSAAGPGSASTLYARRRPARAAARTLMPDARGRKLSAGGKCRRRWLLPYLQFLGAGRRRKPAAVHARRGHSCCSTNSATACTTC
ncbi:hypothetical protein ACTMU2_30490 [Cupriavidus basilensis]